MRSKTSLILSALAALTLITPCAAHARPKNQVPGLLPNLAIDRTRTASQTVIYIRNTGLTASSPCHVRLVLEDGSVFYFGIWDIQAGGSVGIHLPSYQKGKPYAVTITADCQQEVAESNEGDNVETMRF